MANTISLEELDRVVSFEGRFQRKPLNLDEVVSNLSLRSTISGVEKLNFDTGEALKCICRFMEGIAEDVGHWHKMFGDAEFRASKGWNQHVTRFLDELRMRDDRVALKASDLAVLFDNPIYRPTMSALFWRLGDGLGLDVESISRQVLEWGAPCIQQGYLVWGQPLSLSEELHSLYPHALLGDETMETYTNWFDRNCTFYDLMNRTKPQKPENDPAALLNMPSATAKDLEKMYWRMVQDDHMLTFLVQFYTRSTDAGVKRELDVFDANIPKYHEAIIKKKRKENSERLILDSFGGTREEADETISSILTAFAKFKDTDNVTELVATAKEIVKKHNGDIGMTELENESSKVGAGPTTAYVTPDFNDLLNAERSRDFSEVQDPEKVLADTSDTERTAEQVCRISPLKTQNENSQVDSDKNQVVSTVSAVKKDVCATTATTVAPFDLSSNEYKPLEGLDSNAGAAALVDELARKTNEIKDAIVSGVEPSVNNSILEPEETQPVYEKFPGYFTSPLTSTRNDKKSAGAKGNFIASPTASMSSEQSFDSMSPASEKKRKRTSTTPVKLTTKLDPELKKQYMAKLKAEGESSTSSDSDSDSDDGRASLRPDSSDDDESP